jgi:AraC-like DNA-binding protein
MDSDDRDFRKFQFKSPAVVDRKWLEWFREQYGRQFVKLDIELAPDVPPQFDLTTRALPGLAVATILVSSMRVRNMPELATDDDLLIGLPLEGDITVQSDGDAAVLGKSEAMLLAADAPHQVDYRTRWSGFGLRLRRSLIEPLVPNLSDAVAKPFDRTSQAMRLLLGYMRTLDAEEAIASPEARHLVVTHICDLVALALGPTRDISAIAAGRGVRAARLAAVKSDILENLARPNLSVATVAARHGVTPRYVHMLFEAEGATFSEFLLGQRLAHAHRMLTDPRFADRSVGAIAFHVGFSDLSHFNRTFRRRYGATPSDVRAAARRANGE